MEKIFVLASARSGTKFLKDLFKYNVKNDELLTYHYLVAEVFRYLDMPYEKFWALSKTEQADVIWEELFLEHSPISEACRGVLTTLQAFGLDVKKRDLPALRKWFAARTRTNTSPVAWNWPG